MNLNARRINNALAIAWAITVPASIVTGLWQSVAFVSICSIYANSISHWAAARADSPNPNEHQ